jgi:invasion protein IalB
VARTENRFMPASKTTMAFYAVGLLALGALAALAGEHFVVNAHDPRDAMQTVAKLPGWDWILTCQERTKKDGKCLLQQSITQQGNVIAELSVAPKGKSDVMTIVVPLGLLIPPGIGVAIGSGQPRQVAYLTCTQGCIAELPIDDSVAEALAHNTGGKLYVVNGAGNRVPIPFSLHGYGDAMAVRAADTAARSRLGS